MSDALVIDPDLWASSRAGARAGRGFRFQDAVGALLATRIWAGEIASTTLIPEGLDDITLHGGATEFRVQVKSRHDPRGRFTTSELADIIAKAAKTADADALRSGSCRIVVVLERPPEELAASSWDGRVSDSLAEVSTIEPHLQNFLLTSSLTRDALLGATSIVVMPDPLDDCVALISSQRPIADAVARLIAHRLRFQVGDDADRNYRAPSTAPATLGSGDVESIVAAVQALIAPGTMFAAISQGLCEPVSFAPIATPYFYEGVDVAPGHVTAGLVLDRPALITEVALGLQRQRRALIAGPSGSGKSAGAWLFAYQQRHAIRWHRVRRASADEVHLLVQLTRALEASPERPVGFVLDDIGRDLNGVWDALAAELRNEPGVVLLGTTREEDLFLVGNLASTAVIRPELDAELAERIWQELRAERDVTFLHWREPFELSQGLLLEYSHLLNSGQRLQDTLDGQVHRRLAEARDDELAILQAVVPAARFGGAIDAELLRGRLALSAPDFARALARLVDEHAIREGADGSLGGLHQIRSEGLHSALKAQLPRSRDSELAELADVLRPSDFARIIPPLLRDDPAAGDLLLDALTIRAATLGPAQLATVFHGLGLAVCDRVAEAWMNIYGETQLEERQAMFAFTLALGGSTFDTPQFAELNAVIGRIGEVTQRDLRTALIERLSASPATLDCALEEYHDLAASLVPIPFMTPAPTFDVLPAGDWADVPLEAALAVARTVREFGADRGQRIVDLFGGTPHLLSRIHQEIAWATQPAITVEDGEQVVTSNLRYVGEPAQGNANDIVVEHCERLIAAVPTAEIAASAMLGWDGQLAGFADFPLAVKRMPRESLPPPIRVAWNRAILRAIQRRVGSGTESARANALASAITELAEFLADAAECYVRGASIDPLIEQKLAIRSLLNSYINVPSVDTSTRSVRDGGELAFADKAHDFVTEVTKLARDLLGTVERPMVASTEAAKLRGQAQALLDADSWRWIDAPPQAALESLAATLQDLDAVLGNAHAHPDLFRRAQLLANRTSRNRRARIRMAADARSRAEQTAREVADQIRAALADSQLDTEIVTRPMDDAAAPYWPRVDYAVLIAVDNLIEFMSVHEEFTRIVQQTPDLSNVTVVPARNGLIVGALAGLIYQRFLPMLDFAAKWAGHLPLPLLEERAAAALAGAMSVITQLSSVLANLDRDANDEELAFAQTLMDDLRGKMTTLTALRDAEDDADIGAACALILEIMDRLQRELDGEPSEGIAAEIARMANGEQTELTTRFILFRIGLLEFDIATASGQPMPDLVAAIQALQQAAEFESGASAL